MLVQNLSPPCLKPFKGFHCTCNYPPTLPPPPPQPHTLVLAHLLASLISNSHPDSLHPTHTGFPFFPIPETCQASSLLGAFALRSPLSECSFTRTVISLAPSLTTLGPLGRGPCDQPGGVTQADPRCHMTPPHVLPSLSTLLAWLLTL